MIPDPIGQIALVGLLDVLRKIAEESKAPEETINPEPSLQPTEEAKVEPVL